ncbi:MAG: thioesterase family protein [Candidatus Tectomicrobia bacterium]|nr:thioesterase family protein [Candidatus Tectomicrobia bacterium]
MKDGLHVGESNETAHVVQPSDGISHMGPNVQSVLSTPSMIRLIEQCSRLILERHFEEGDASVGYHVNVFHLAAAKVGDTIRTTSKVKEINKRRVTFEVESWNGETKIGEGTHVRVVVNKQRFAGEKKS